MSSSTTMTMDSIWMMSRRAAGYTERFRGRLRLISSADAAQPLMVGAAGDTWHVMTRQNGDSQRSTFEVQHC
ncbi:hypothetical protein CBR_g39603 [Chara braunii]|uniref:Uncharacterized protein n=1 Tax=Chara braunii TaxID=69332 RepID=A0A388K1A7_CHABU|nr:hypothetical protein CBR_g39603 [Chara braunii]|eukprot:GBG63819.1 hypothetical protein CBR_g39603 [Chara braunii]